MQRDISDPDDEGSPPPGAPEDEQYDVPLFRGLIQHAKKNPLPFHIPGHKRGMGMDPAFREFLGANALAIDLVNIAPVDDLHHPQGIIQEAQELAAKAFGADRSFFSVQGTSGAILAMIMAVVGPGDKILIPRNVHKSVLTAVVLSGAHPVFMEPRLTTSEAWPTACRLPPSASGWSSIPTPRPSWSSIPPTLEFVPTCAASLIWCISETSRFWSMKPTARTCISIRSCLCLPWRRERTPLPPVSTSWAAR